jgi:hypothetical protein
MPTTVGFGVSDTLRSIFDGLSQAQGLSGQKYSDIDINKVRQYVTCRNYSKASLELVYLCWAIVNAYPSRRGASSLEAFFWLDEAYTPKRFRQAFKQRWQDSSGTVALTQVYLNLEVGNKAFSISPSRVGVLAVLMEFIITVDPSLIHTIQSSLYKANAKAIDQLAKQIQKSVYQFLKSHLPEAQIQTRYRYFEAWLNQSTKSPASLDDEDIMAFWQDASEDKHAQSYVLYSTALFDVLDALSAINIVESQQGVAFAKSFGAEVEFGEIDPELVQALLFSETTDQLDVKGLCQAPKCLTQEEAQWLEPMNDYKLYSQKFLLSFMRLQVFAPWQSVLVQAKRKSQAKVTEKLAEVPVQGYAMYQLEVSGLSKALTYAQNCLLHVLLERDPELACAELLQKLPQEQLRLIAEFLLQQKQQSQASGSSLLKQASLQFSAFRQLIQTAEQAFKKNNKAGFKTLPEQDELEPYIKALQHITQLQALLDKHQDNILKLDSQILSLSSIFSSDVCIFTNRFNTLYGGSNAN